MSISRLLEIQKRNSDLTSANHKLSQGEQQSSWQQQPLSLSYDVCLGDKRPAMLIRTFSDLYSTARLDTLDALDALPDLRTQMMATGVAIGRVDAEELKNKLLFSVVVVSTLFPFCHFLGNSIQHM